MARFFHHSRERLKPFPCYCLRDTEELSLAHLRRLYRAYRAGGGTLFMKIVVPFTRTGNVFELPNFTHCRKSRRELGYVETFWFFESWSWANE